MLCGKDEPCPHAVSAQCRGSHCGGLETGTWSDTVWKRLAQELDLLLTSWGTLACSLTCISQWWYENSIRIKYLVKSLAFSHNKCKLFPLLSKPACRSSNTWEWQLARAPPLTATVLRQQELGQAALPSWWIRGLDSFLGWDISHFLPAYQNINWYTYTMYKILR